MGGNTTHPYIVWTEKKVMSEPRSTRNPIRQEVVLFLNNTLHRKFPSKIKGWATSIYHVPIPLSTRSSMERCHGTWIAMYNRFISERKCCLYSGCLHSKQSFAYVAPTRILLRYMILLTIWVATQHHSSCPNSMWHAWSLPRLQRPNSEARPNQPTETKPNNRDQTDHPCQRPSSEIVILAHFTLPPSWPRSAARVCSCTATTRTPRGQTESVLNFLPTRIIRLL